jgi:hypothetical protein
MQNQWRQESGLGPIKQSDRDQATTVRMPPLHVDALTTQDGRGPLDAVGKPGR